MKLDTCGDLENAVLLNPETDEEIELLAAIVECIRTGGDIRAIPGNANGSRLIFDGDERFVT